MRRGPGPHDTERAQKAAQHLEAGGTPEGSNYGELNENLTRGSASQKLRATCAPAQLGPPASGPVQPRESQQRAKEGDDVERLPEPGPIRPPSDSCREFRRWSRIKRYPLKCQHLADEEQAAPHAHDDIGCQAYEEQPPHRHLMPRQGQRHEKEKRDRRMHRDPEPFQGHASPALDDRERRWWRRTPNGGQHDMLVQAPPNAPPKEKQSRINDQCARSVVIDTSVFKNPPLVNMPRHARGTYGGRDRNSTCGTPS